MTQEKTLEIMRKGKDIFLTGKPGTGKTYIINKYIKELEEQNKKVIITASTGIAALNIDGVTAHRAFSIPVPAYGKDYRKITLSSLKPIQNADVIFLDEVSMLRNDAFEYICACIDLIEKTLQKHIQFIVSGDFFQLSPIVKKEELSKFRTFGLDPSGLCFTTPAWKKRKFVTVELTEIVRQSDEEYIANLDKLRRGDYSCIPYFNQFVGKGLPDGTIHICATNREASEFNQEELKKIESMQYAYTSITTGRVTEYDKPADDVLLLKNGCRIIFTANDLENNNYRNGQFGTVKECLVDKIVVTLDSGKDLIVSPRKASVYTYSVTNGLLNKKEVGSFTQLPVKLAAAITIHKSQGQTYDSAVINPSSFAEGQLYVVLSRVRSAEGLSLTNEIYVDDIRVNKKVEKFYETFTYEIKQSVLDKKKEVAVKQAKAKTKRKTTRKRVTKPAAKKPTVKKVPAKRTSTKTAKTSVVKNTTRKTTRKPIAASKTTTKSKRVVKR